MMYASISLSNTIAFMMAVGWAVSVFPFINCSESLTMDGRFFELNKRGTDEEGS